MRKKKVSTGWLAAVFLAVMLLGCGKKQEEVVTLTPAVDSAPVQQGEEAGADNAAGSAERPAEESGPADAETGTEEETAEAAAQEASAEEAAAQEMDVSEILTQEYALHFANLTGMDIVKLQITFNTGNIQNLEVLGEKRLYDGDEYIYKSSQLDGLQGASRLKLTVTATAKDATVMLFPEIEVLDLAHTNVILTRTKEGYEMYLQ